MRTGFRVTDVPRESGLKHTDPDGTAIVTLSPYADHHPNVQAAPAHRTLAVSGLVLPESRLPSSARSASTTHAPGQSVYSHVSLTYQCPVVVNVSVYVLP